MRYRGDYIGGLCFGLIMSLMLIGCTANNSQDDEDGGTARVSLRLSAANATRAFSGGNASRASFSDGNNSRASFSDGNAVEGEMMKKYIVIVVNSDGIIEKYFAKDFSDSEVNEKEEDTVVENFDLSKGKKTFYSFANMTLKEATGMDEVPTEGVTAMPDISTRTFSTQGNSYTLPDGGIPMSNKEEFTISGDQTIELKVIRLYAKMKLTITNNLSSGIKITSLKLSDITKNGQNISLLPPTAAQALETTSLSLLTEEPLSIKSTESTESTFYLNESATPKNDFGLFILDIAFTDADGNNKQQRYAMITTDEEDGDQEFSVINRNDYLQIPIVIDEYRLGLNVVDFAPIGVVTTVKAVDNYMLCNFTMPDIHFHLIPVVLKGNQKLTLGTDFTMATSNGSYIKTIDNDGTLYASSSGSETTGSDASHNGGSPLWDATRGFFFGKIAESPTANASATHSIKAKVTSGDITLRYYFKVEYSGR